MKEEESDADEDPYLLRIDHRSEKRGRPFAQEDGTPREGKELSENEDGGNDEQEVNDHVDEESRPFRDSVDDDIHYHVATPEEGVSRPKHDDEGKKLHVDIPRPYRGPVKEVAHDDFKHGDKRHGREKEAHTIVSVLIDKIDQGQRFLDPLQWKPFLSLISEHRGVPHSRILSVFVMLNNSTRSPSPVLTNMFSHP